MLPSFAVDLFIVYHLRSTEQMLMVVIVVAVTATSSNDTALQQIQQDINDKVATLKRHVSSFKDPSITDAGNKTCEKESLLCVIVSVLIENHSRPCYVSFTSLSYPLISYLANGMSSSRSFKKRPQKVSHRKLRHRLPKYLTKPKHLKPKHQKRHHLVPNQTMKWSASLSGS